MAKSIFIHAGGRLVAAIRRSSRDKAPARDEDFESREAWIEALLAKLEEMDAADAAQAKTHDDGGAQQGHPFYGNQYTDVAGQPKPTEAKTKSSVKAALHELLTSGHPFSLDELMAATGSKSKSNLTTAITHLKGANPHELGVLNILKNDKGEYHLDPNKPPSLEPYIPKPKPKAPDPAPEAAQASAEPPALANPPAPAATAPTPPPAASPGLPVAKAPATPMSKAEADVAYAQHLDAANKAAAVAFEGGKSTKEIAKDWKEAKAQAMAQWKANTSGADQKPHPVEVFKEDEWLVEQLALAADSKDPDGNTIAALSKWKQDTQAAKQAAFSKAQQAAAPAPPITPATPKPAAIPNVVPTGPGAFKAPEAIVPKDWKGIDHAEFVGNDYEQSIAKVHKALHASSKDSVGNKIAVQAGLEKRLAASHHFQNMQAQYAKANPYASGPNSSLAARLISAWAGSSGDHHAASVSPQLMIREAFGMNKDDVEHKAFGILESNSEEKVHKMAAQEFGIDVSTSEKMASYKEGMKDFALAQYHETQDHLAKLGIKELHLVRGMKFGSSSTGPRKVKVKLQPASSFTTAHGTAHSFAGGHSMFVVKVPASQVLGSFCTGYGCTNESEVVVLNHPDMESIQIGTSHAPNATQMAHNIKTQLGKTQAPASPAQQAATAKQAAINVNGLPTPKIPDHISSEQATAMFNAVEDNEADAAETIKATIAKLSPADYPGTIAYGKKLLAHLGHGPAEPAGHTPNPNNAPPVNNLWSKPVNAPAKPSGVKNKTAQHAVTAAKSGSVDDYVKWLNTFNHEKKMTGNSFPASSGWLGAVHEHMMKKPTFAKAYKHLTGKETL